METHRLDKAIAETRAERYATAPAPLSAEAERHEFVLLPQDPTYCARYGCVLPATAEVHDISRLSAEEQLLYEAVLRVIDDGDGRAAGAEYGRKPWLVDHDSEEIANAQRAAFAREVIATWNRFKREG